MRSSYSFAHAREVVLKEIQELRALAERARNTNFSGAKGVWLELYNALSGTYSMEKMAGLDSIHARFWRHALYSYNRSRHFYSIPRGELQDAAQGVQCLLFILLMEAPSYSTVECREAICIAEAVHKACGLTLNFCKAEEEFGKQVVASKSVALVVPFRPWPVVSSVSFRPTLQVIDGGWRTSPPQGGGRISLVFNK